MALDTVLVAVGPGDEERTDPVVTAVSDVAGPAEASVVLAHVFSRERFAEMGDRLGFGDDAEPDAVAARQTTVGAFRDRLTEAGLDVSVRGRVGDVGEGVVALAEGTDADLVFVGGRKRRPSGKAVFGSTAQTVLLEAPCPVTFVRSG
ncbi:universal stress protein [Halosimplex pelagicum]|uniref:Universal stress protein n=1 Tax=Halosimplex pelagicum TaxID=869886 RepID=A0A7D5T6X1_9EURY|nr:universal stress protein [Halosimplex pelagicum]QLH83628.1 universal stress protein [Halosimplex pelagicum]